MAYSLGLLYIYHIYPRPISSLPVSLPEGGREGGQGRGRKGREGPAEKGGREGEGGGREGAAGERGGGEGGAEGTEGNFT